MGDKKRIEVLKHKIRAVGRMARIWNIQKKNANLILTLKEMCPDGKIPAGTLIQGRQGIKNKLMQFMTMKDLDKENEKWKGPRKYTVDQLAQTRERNHLDQFNFLEMVRDQRILSLPTKSNKIDPRRRDSNPMGSNSS